MVHIVRPDGRHETAVFDSIPDPVRVRDLINQTVHQVRAAAHQRQVAEQQNLNVHRYEATGPVPAAPPAAGMPSAPPPQYTPAGTPPAAAGQQAYTADQVMEMLKKLGELRDAGVVTPEEFEAKKKDLLDRI